MKPAKCTEGIRFEDLADYVENRLVREKAEQIKRHLGKGCATCQNQINLLQRTFNAMQKDAQLQPAFALLEKAKNAFRSRYGRPSLLERLKAVLVFDSRANLAYGVRRAGTLESFQLLYRLDDYELDLQVLTPSATQASHFGLIGQLLPFEQLPVETTVFLLGRAGRSYNTKMSESGEFEFQGLASGEYRLEIALENKLIELENLYIGLK